MNAETDRRWLREAIDTSRRCSPSRTAYAVGAVIIDGEGHEVSRGYSRDQGPTIHAEQSALLRIDHATLDLSAATIYTSMEPCTSRRSEPVTCSELIIGAGIGRVVLALHEPLIFAACVGVATLREAGVEVVPIPDLAAEVEKINAALLGSSFTGPA